MEPNPYESPRFAYNELERANEPVGLWREEAKLFLYTLSAMLIVLAAALVAGATG